MGIGPEGCQPCDECVTSLRDQNSQLNSTLDRVDMLAVEAAALQSADTLDIPTLLNTVNQLWMVFDGINDTVTSIQAKLSDSQSQVDSTGMNMTSLRAEVSPSPPPHTHTHLIQYLIAYTVHLPY